MTDLKPCPFCGKNFQEINYPHNGWDVVLCGNCGATGPYASTCIGGEQEKKWNARTYPPMNDRYAGQDADNTDREEFTTQIGYCGKHGYQNVKDEKPCPECELNKAEARVNELEEALSGLVDAIETEGITEASYTFWKNLETAVAISKERTSGSQRKGAGDGDREP